MRPEIWLAFGSFRTGCKLVLMQRDAFEFTFEYEKVKSRTGLL